MEMTDDIGHLSIGEVLALLQSEFPDVTISKIRFLESQGLIDPERTPSGYRKFFELDIIRLTWILRQQRDHFLPLKVIKAKLEQDGDIDFHSNEAAQLSSQPHLWSQETSEAAAAAPRQQRSFLDRPPAPPVTAPRAQAANVAPRRHPAAGTANGAQASTADGPSTGDAASATPASAEHDAAAWLAALQESPRPGARGVAPGTTSTPSNTSPGEPGGTADTDSIKIGRAELAEITGIALDDLDSLVSYGLLTENVIGGEAMFDATSVAVIRGVQPFLARGVEARHLRMFKNSAEREAGFYEQMILPLLKQRNPKSRQVALETLAELMDAGDELGRSLVRQALRSHLGD